MVTSCVCVVPSRPLFLWGTSYIFLGGKKYFDAGEKRVGEEEKKLSLMLGGEDNSGPMAAYLAILLLCRYPGKAFQAPRSPQEEEVTMCPLLPI